MTKTTNTEKAVKELDKLFTIYGLPASIATENVPQFVNATFKKYMEENGIAHCFGRPQTVKLRQNRSLLKSMNITNAEKKLLEMEVQTVYQMKEEIKIYI